MHREWAGLRRGAALKPASGRQRVAAVTLPPGAATATSGSSSERSAGSASR